jgi:hypothetical protein
MIHIRVWGEERERNEKRRIIIIDSLSHLYRTGLLAIIHFTLQLWRLTERQPSDLEKEVKVHLREIERFPFQIVAINCCMLCERHQSTDEAIH